MRSTRSKSCQNWFMELDIKSGPSFAPKPRAAKPVSSAAPRMPCLAVLAPSPRVPPHASDDACRIEPRLASRSSDRSTFHRDISCHLPQALSGGGRSNTTAAREVAIYSLGSRHGSRRSARRGSEDSAAASLDSLALLGPLEHHSTLSRIMCKVNYDLFLYIRGGTSKECYAIVARRMSARSAAAHWSPRLPLLLCPAGASAGMIRCRDVSRSSFFRFLVLTS